MIQPFVRIRGAASDLASDGRGWILLSVASGWFLSLGIRLVYPVLLPYLRTEFDMTLGGAGLLLTALWLAYAAGQLPGGVLTDRLGERRLLVGSSLLSGLALLLIVVSATEVVLLATTMLYGFGTAMYGVARFTITSHIYPERDGLAIGVTQAAGEIGNSILPPIAGLLAATVAWQLGFGFAIPLFVVVAVALWLVIPDSRARKSSAVGSLSLSTVRYVVSQLTNRTIYTLLAIQILGLSVWQAFTGFYPTYLIEVKGVGETFSTVMFGLFFAVGVVVQLLAGNAYDRFGIRRSLPSVLGVVVVALVLLPSLDSHAEIFAGTLLLSSIPGYTTITMAYLTRTIPSDMEGTGLGMIRSGYITIGAVSPVLFGVFAERGYFDEGFYVLAVLAGLAIVCCLALPRGCPEKHS